MLYAANNSYLSFRFNNLFSVFLELFDLGAACNRSSSAAFLKFSCDETPSSAKHLTGIYALVAGF